MSSNDTQEYNSEIGLAQDFDSDQPVENNLMSSLTSMVPLILVFGVIYFLLIRPQEKKRRMHEDMVKTVKKGEKVVTNSGIYGVVTKLNDSEGTVMLEVAKDVQIQILKSAVADILSRKESSKSQ